MIPTMDPNPLTPRVLALSWGTALLCWPLAWAVLACAQGLGVALAGGGWIGVSIPLGAHPWAAVNEPGITFAASRAALFLYWLAAPLAALGAAVVLPSIVPVPRGWSWELAVFQLATAVATLGLGWCAGLGGSDAPSAGLARFWSVPTTVFTAASALLGAAAVEIAVVRLAGHLWSKAGGPLRSRRVLVALLHVFPPAVGWVAATAALGWAVPPAALVTIAAVAVGALVGGWVWTPHAPLRPRPSVGWGRVFVTLAFGCLVLAAVSWAGRPHGGQGVALVWGVPRETSNIPAGAAVVRITPRLAPRTRQAP